MTEEPAGAWTHTSRVIRARPEELYAAFLDPTAFIDWLPPAEMTGEILTQMEMTKAPEAVDPGAVDHVLVWARTGL